MLYQIDITYACFGIVIDKDGIVIETAPIGRWMVGKHLSTITKWVESKKGSISLVRE